MSSKNPGCLAAIFGIKPKTMIRNRVAKSQNTHPDPSTIRPSESIPIKDEPVAIKKEIPVHPVYASRGILLTNAEASFFHFLRTMTKDYLIIFPHVALRDLVTVIDQAEYYTHYNKIDRKQVDFVLCEPKTLKPVFVIELDDKSHCRPDRIERDTFVEDVLASSKIPLVRIPVSHNYDPQLLGTLFKGAVEKYVTEKNTLPDHLYTIDNPPFCPTHNVRMILRTAHRTGKKFWGCPNYPDCRQVFQLQDSPN